MYEFKESEKIIIKEHQSRARFLEGLIIAMVDAVEPEEKISKEYNKLNDEYDTIDELIYGGL